MMARKKNLEKNSEGTSSPAKLIDASSFAPSHSVNPALKSSGVPTPSIDTKPIDLDVVKSKPKRKSAQEKTPSPQRALLTGPMDPNVHVADRL